MNAAATANGQDEGVFVTFNTEKKEKKKRTEKSHSLALALTLILTIWLQSTADNGGALPLMHQPTLQYNTTRLKGRKLQ